MTRLHLFSNCIRAALVITALAVIPPVSSIAAEQDNTSQNVLAPESKSASKSENKGADKSSDGGPDNSNSESKVANRANKAEGKESDNKSAEKSGKKEDDKDNKSESPPEAKEESKPEEPCSQEKLLFKSPEREQLCKSAGLKLGITETSEVLGNPTGGQHQGVIYEGVTDLSLSIDLRPTLHTRGNVFARAYQIHGRGLTTTIGNLNEISGIEAAATTRLVELWYEQHFDSWRIRVGQQTIGTEFINPESARVFVNGAFGWPTLPSLDLPSGGPGYPLGTPAIRVRVDPFEGLTVFSALFNSDPTGAGVGGSQLADASGTAFRIGDGAFFINEIRYNPESSDKKGTYRFGGWYNSERFRDLRFDTSGAPLASPLSDGRARRHDGDYSLYAVVDQPFLVDDKSHTSFTAFAGAMGAPSDRNLIDLFLEGGLIYKGPFGRADDQVGIALAYARVGDAARGFDADIARFSGSPYPIRSGETVLELTYRFQVTPWCQVQPDFQYVFAPGGGAPSISAPTRRIGDAALLGLRTAITF